MIAIIDYGAGNIFSVLNALEYLGVPAELTADGDKIRQADAIILPGVGAFPDAMRMLHATGLTELLKEEAGKKPFLGICLGMQMLFEKSWEFEETEGLGLIPGEIVRIPDTGLKIPHMGWNQLEITQSCPFLEGIKDGDSVYFVHSYMAKTEPENVVAYSDYGVQVPALVRCGNVYGAQYHPEKSGAVGLQMLRNFAGR
ncbi:MAG: imidazole glycerol phosphate synthase subunit HisH [Oscillospiraceae bacterium]|nr:imidazole glycerol phosphate synthase subunit HisH [Oscillospiraceae bacterium]